MTNFFTNKTDCFRKIVCSLLSLFLTFTQINLPLYADGQAPALIVPQSAESAQTATPETIRTSDAQQHTTQIPGDFMGGNFSGQTGALSPVEEESEAENTAEAEQVPPRTYSYSSSDRKLRVQDNTAEGGSKVVAIITLPTEPHSFSMEDAQRAADELLSFYDEADLSGQTIQAAYNVSAGKSRFIFTVSGGNQTDTLTVSQKADNTFESVSFVRRQAGAQIFEAQMPAGSDALTLKINHIGPPAKTQTITASLPGDTDLAAITVLRSATLLLNSFIGTMANQTASLNFSQETGLFQVVFQLQANASHTYYYSANGVFERLEVMSVNTALGRSYFFSSTEGVTITNLNTGAQIHFTLENLTFDDFVHGGAFSGPNGALDAFLGFYSTTAFSGEVAMRKFTNAGKEYISFTTVEPDGDTIVITFLSSNLVQPTISQTRDGKTIEMRYVSSPAAKVGYYLSVQMEGEAAVNLPAKINFIYRGLNGFTFTNLSASERSVNLLFEAVRSFETAFNQNGTVEVKNTAPNVNEFTLKITNSAPGALFSEVNFATVGAEIRATFKFKDSQNREYNYSDDGTLVVKKANKEIYRLNLIDFKIERDKANLLTIVNTILLSLGGTAPANISVDNVFFEDFFGRPATSINVAVGDIDSGNFDLYSFFGDGALNLFQVDRRVNNEDVYSLNLLAGDFTTIANGTYQSFAVTLPANTPVTRSLFNALVGTTAYYGGAVPEGSVVNVIAQSGGKFRVDVTTAGQTTQLSFDKDAKLTNVKIGSKAFTISVNGRDITVPGNKKIKVPANTPVTPDLLLSLEQVAAFGGTEITQIRITDDGLLNLSVKSGSTTYDLMLDVSSGTPVPVMIIANKPPKSATIEFQQDGTVLVTNQKVDSKSMNASPASTLISRALDLK